MNHNKRSVASCVFSLVVFALLSASAPAEWKEKVLYSFHGGSDGATPAGGVVFDQHGNLYGATADGGSSCPAPGCGTVFQLVAPAKKGDPWTETILHMFNGKDGTQPTGGLLIDSNGNLYGVTGYGGSGGCQLQGSTVGCGLVYELSPPAKKGGAWTATMVYSFQGGEDGQYPTGALVFDTAGNLYGATIYGGGFQGTCNAPFYLYCGTVFELSPPTKKGGKWKEKVLHSFKGVKSGQDSGDGASPNGGLVLDNTGAIYGTTYFGGNNKKGICEGGVAGTGCGIVYRLSPPVSKGGPWTKKVLHLFNAQDGSNSAAGVVFDGSGNLYGTTSFGPPNGFGLVFELKKPSGKSHSWTEKVLCLFNDGNNGAYPIAGLVFDTSGDLYGTTSGGAQFRGDVIRLKPPRQKGADWIPSVLYGFMGSPNAAHPASSLVLDKAGDLFGTTQWGGAGQSCQGGCGAVFQVAP
jgi:hypothetical protein